MAVRLLGLAIAAVALAACSGASTASSVPSTPASAATSPSSELVGDFDVGDGRTMHLVCVGPTDTGEPTILLESGGGMDYSAWSEILPVMESTHRLCAYDRAGLGASQPPPEPSRTAADQVADLRALLDAADVSGPFVVGSWSYGATLATLFTKAYPDDVVGLLFVDPQSPRVVADWREALPAPAADEPASVRSLREEFDTFYDDPSQNPEHVHLLPSLAEAAAALEAPGQLFGDRPVIVLSAGSTPATKQGLPADLASTLEELWITAQQRLADESTAGTREIVPGAGHAIQAEKPEAVINGLEKVLTDLATT
jgi:pimeloyl-ACP methyl ester carboxylesterase